MSLFQRLNDDLKEAMKSGETLRRDVIRMAIAAMKNRRIELIVKELDATEELGVLQKCVKTREESALVYDQGGRPELAQKERDEIAILQTYLPKKLSEAETRATIAALAQELGVSEKKQLGVLMKAVTARYQGQIDGKLASKLAGEILK
jgi:uncharacterized protein YqeY